MWQSTGIINLLSTSNSLNYPNSKSDSIANWIYQTKFIC